MKKHHGLMNAERCRSTVNRDQKKKKSVSILLDYVCSYSLRMYPHRAETEASVVLAYKVIKVTSDFSPDKETTKGMERIENSSKKDLFVLAE